MSAISRAALITAINTLLADNTNGDVSLSDFRSVLIDTADSCANPITDTTATGAYKFSGATQYYNNQITNYLGNWYIANTTTTVNGSFNASEWDALANNLFKATLNLSSAQILLLFTTPIQVVAAVSGKSIQVVSANIAVAYLTAPYATNTSPYLYTDTATYAQSDFPTSLAASLSRKSVGQHNTAGISIAAGETQLIDNKGLFIKCAANPTAGSGTAIITVYYLLV